MCELFEPETTWRTPPPPCMQLQIPIRVSRYSKAIFGYKNACMYGDYLRRGLWDIATV